MRVWGEEEGREENREKRKEKKRKEEKRKEKKREERRIKLDGGWMDGWNEERKKTKQNIQNKTYKTKKQYTRDNTTP